MSGGFFNCPITKLLNYKIKKGVYVHNRKVRQRCEEEGEVFEPPAQPLQVVRAAARVPAQVWHLPLVLPGPGPARRDTRRVEIVVVRVVSSFKFRFRASEPKRET
jgi:hypothetical protein